MRKIKFRACIKKEKCIFQVTEMNFRSNGMVYSVSPNQGEDWFLVEEDVELMQYTGLKDKNGIEIYEGDILKVQNRNYIVLFKEGSFIGKNKDDGRVSEPILYILMNYPTKNECKIVGNIYENKELLEREDD